MKKYMVNFHLYKKGCLKSFESELIEKASDVVLKVDLPHSQLLCYLYQLHWIRALRWEWSFSDKLSHKLLVKSYPLTKHNLYPEVLKHPYPRPERQI